VLDYLEHFAEVLEKFFKLMKFYLEVNVFL
jgi:hypothetical protein